MINPNVVGSPIPDYATRVPQTGGELNSPANANGFSEVMTSAEAYHEDCVGTMNEVNLDDFFAAWGSSDSSFDIDNSGTVDAQDLSMFLGMNQPNGPPAPGSAEDIHSQWGTVGHSTADLNADYIVDGLDLALSLGDSPPVKPPVHGSAEDIHAQWGTVGHSTADLNADYIVDGLDLALSLGDSPPVNSVTLSQLPVESPLQSILDNWGTAESTTDLDGDGNTSGSDLTMLLSGLSGVTQAEVEPVQVSPVSQQIFDILNEMGFEEQAPVNINQVIDGLRMGTFESKSVTMELLDLYGKNSKSDGREAQVARR